MKISKVTVLCILSSTILGCGYTLQGGGSVLPAEIKKVYIPNVENNSTEPGLSSVMTEALRDRFEQFGVLSVVDELGEADAILNARIVGVKRSTDTVKSKVDTALQYNTVLTLGAELRRTNGEILWRDPKIAVSRSYGTAANVIVTSSPEFSTGNLSAADLGALGARELSRGQETETLNDLAEQAAKVVYDDAVAPDF